MKKLTALSVPWMVSPSAPILTLTSIEDGAHSVKFVGFFGYETGGEEILNNQIIVNAHDDELTPNPLETSARYQVISLDFELVGWIRRSSQHSDREVISESDYDWSNVPGDIRQGESTLQWDERFSRDWAATHICPNPGAYIVEDSDWNIGPSKEQFGLKHFLILGESSSVEIMAKNFRWVSMGNITR